MPTSTGTLVGMTVLSRGARSGPRRMPTPPHPDHALFHTVADDAGMVTVEAAYALTALLSVAVLGCAGLGAGLTQLRVTDYAHLLARDAARTGIASAGTSARTPSGLPPGTQATVTITGDEVHATVTAPAPLLPFTLHSSATMPLEPATRLAPAAAPAHVSPSRP